MTMMMWTLTKLIIVMSCCIGFVTGLGFFPQTYYAAPQNQYTNYTLGDVEELTTPQDPGIGDYFLTVVTWLVSSLMVILMAAGAIVVLLPFLVYTFHMPIGLAVLFQGIIYLQYAIGWAQWRSGRAIKIME